MTAPSKQETTTLLTQVTADDGGAAEELFRLVYDDLRALAKNMFRRQHPGHTLQSTALVHEAYIRLIDQSKVTWHDRAHFFAMAAKAMRHVLIDHARARATGKRGGGWQRIPLDDSLKSSDSWGTDLLALDSALKELAEEDQRKARVVELRFFAGMSVEETADVLAVSKTTVEGDWRFARAWLSRMLGTEDPH